MHDIILFIEDLGSYRQLNSEFRNNELLRRTVVDLDM